MGTLSVRENLAFSAALRLPTSVSKQERDKKVESVIAELGLSHVASSMVIYTIYNQNAYTCARAHTQNNKTYSYIYTCSYVFW